MAEKQGGAEPGQRRDYRQEITNRIIDAIERGVAPWQKGWKPGETELPFNPTTDQPYHGGNTIRLLLEGRADPRWCTYKQAQAQGWQVRTGERGTTIEYWKFDDRRSKTSPEIDANDGDAKPSAPIAADADSETRRTAPRPFYAVVFNAEQIEGIPPLTVSTPDWDPAERAERLLTSTGARFTYGGNQAYYNPVQEPNTIHLPTRGQFTSDVAFYDTAFHEVAHWTGHADRLGRELTGTFGTQSYAKEELRAELAATFIAAQAGVARDIDNNAAYVDSWVHVLRSDKNEIFRAAADAQRISDFVFELALDKERSPNDVPKAVDVIVDASAGPDLVRDVVSDKRSRANSLVSPSTSDKDRELIVATLVKFPREVIDLLKDGEISFRGLRDDERYDQASRELRKRGVDVDSWPVPPAGLFVVSERTVYLRSKNEMTVAHEGAHGIDCALGKGRYQSTFDPTIRAAFESAVAFVTPYAASGIDEFFAESARAYFSMNSADALWPKVSRERLEQTNPTMARFFDNMLETLRNRVESVESSISSLPVFEPRSSDVVELREKFAFGFAQTLEVIGKSEDGSRVFGRNGGAILSVDRDTFAEEPSVGEMIRIERVDGVDRAESLGRESALGIG